MGVVFDEVEMQPTADEHRGPEAASPERAQAPQPAPLDQLARELRRMARREMRLKAD
jgi:hypothetical protein